MFPNAQDLRSRIAAIPGTVTTTGTPAPAPTATATTSPNTTALNPAQTAATGVRARIAAQRAEMDARRTALRAGRTTTPGTGTPSSGGLGAAYNNATSVADRVNILTKQNSPLMQAAATAGLQSANARGLGNSSMAAQASQQAVINAATGIAGNDATLASQESQFARELKQRESQFGRELTSRERTNLANQIAQIESQRLASLPNMYTNPDLPATARSGGLNSINQYANQTIAYMQSLYGSGLTS